MAVQIAIPKPGMTVDDVNLVEWKAKEGDHIETGTVVLVIKPVVRNGQIVIAPIMPYSLTFDHRAINGFGAEQFLGTLQRFIETPSLLLF